MGTYLVLDAAYDGWAVFFGAAGIAIAEDEYAAKAAAQADFNARHPTPSTEKERAAS
jgi:hypothetical protein